MGNVFFSGGGNGVFTALDVYVEKVNAELNILKREVEDGLQQLEEVRELSALCQENTNTVILCNQNVNNKYEQIVNLYNSIQEEIETLKNQAIEEINDSKDGVLEYVLGKIETTRDSVLAIALQAKEYAQQAKESAEEIAEIFGNKNLQFKIVNTFDIEIPEEWIEEMEYKRGVTLKDNNGDELLADFVSEEGEVLCDTTSVKWKSEIANG